MLHNAECRNPIERHQLRDGSKFSESSMTANFSRLVTVGVFVIQLTIPAIFSTYGVLLMYLIENKYFAMWHGLLPPIFFITTRSFTDPFCRNIITGQSFNSRKIAMCAIFVIAGSIAVNMFMQSFILQLFTYGIFGGVFSSIVIMFAEAVLSCHFPAHRSLTQVLNHLAVALGYFGMPLLINGLISQYGIPGSFLLQSGIVLQALVGAAVLQPPQDEENGNSFINRPRTYTVVDDVEMIDLSQNNGHSGHSPLLSAGRSWRNPATDSQCRYDTAQTSSPVTLIKQKNIYGVDILPEIPEESEESSSESESPNYVCQVQHGMEDISRHEQIQVCKQREKQIETFVKLQKENEQAINSKSFHKWRNFNLLSEHDERKTTHQKDEIQERNPVNPVEEINDISFVRCSDNIRFQRLESTSEHQFAEKSLFQNIKYVFLCSCCNSASCYDLYLKILNIPNDVYFHLVVPLINAIKVPDFFSAVFLYTVLRLCSIVFFTFIPILTRRRILTSTTQEGAFTISVTAFSWLCFLLFSPCFLQAKLNTKKLIYFIGSMLFSTGLYIISTTRSHGYIVLGCAFVGLGYAATSGTITSIFEDGMGARNFVKVQGPLDVVSGCIILLISVLLGILLHNEDGLFYCFIILTVSQVATSFVWIISLLKMLLLQLRFFVSSDWHPGGDFLTPS